MALLPGGLAIQQNGGVVTISDQVTGEEYLSFNPANATEAAKAQRRIAADERMDTEQKSFAHFWSGYFYAHARG